jgi:four helix bundle protein
MQNNNPKFKMDIKKRAYLFAVDMLKFADGFADRKLSADILLKQLLRSTTSIGANIIEAQAGRTRKDFSNFLNHALKSANETKFWLCLLREVHQDKREKVNKLLKEAIELSNILAASIIKLRNKG